MLGLRGFTYVVAPNQPLVPQYHEIHLGLVLRREVVNALRLVRLGAVAD